MKHFTHIARPLSVLAAASLVLTACGGDDSVQQELADEARAAIEPFAERQGIDVDEDCVRNIISELSDEEAEAGLGVFADPDSDSEAFDATGEQIEDECFSAAEE